MDHVTVIHHHPWARRGLEQALIASGGFAVTVCASAAAGITAVRERPRTNVLVAYALPALDDLLSGLRQRGHQDVPVALIGDPVTMARCPGPLPPGVSGFLPEEVDPRALCHAVHTMAAGAAVLPLAMLWFSYGQAPGRSLPETSPSAFLTLREREILALIGAGLTNLEISDRLGLTVSTVKAYVSNMYGKIGVDNRVRAALFAHGIAFAPDVVHAPRAPGPGRAPAVPGG
ncbi:response regulator transcription factor [Streptomyces sp. WAC08241]|uniref:response regulator transcription factor n=1 Tax=Streptomyces sp. WAC08241 TaxID=2487421 RepID=UPI000F771496|nr:response regulator transcription factor [Streptomyces sp. WAC08241]RSS37664.1 DNA-binding response regulator [Streptomyces sp. WAC08241]